MKKILFLNDCNGNEYEDPKAHLLEIPEGINNKILHALEQRQNGVERTGGHWEEIMERGDIEHTLLKGGHASDFKEDEYDEIYRLISGNY